MLLKLDKTDPALPTPIPCPLALTQNTAWSSGVGVRRWHPWGNSLSWGRSDSCSSAFLWGYSRCRVGL